MFKKILKKFTIDPVFQLGTLASINNYDIYSKVEKSHQLLSEFYLFNESDQCNAVFYPSSNEDISDLNFFYGIDFDLGIQKPNLYIHTDSFIIHESICDLSFIHQNINIKNGIRLLYNTESENEICYLLEIENNNITNWLILFSGKANEDMVKEIVKNKFRIPYLYSKCDGILSGMGGRGELIDPIGVAYYIYFYKLFNTKYHITEFNKTWFNNFIRNDSRAHNQELFAKRMYKKLTGSKWDDQFTLDTMLDNIVEQYHNVENQTNLTILSTIN